MKKDTSKKPFFARLLEQQELEHVVGGGTLKYPSDTDEDRGSDVSTVVFPPPGDTTHKYPSDSDEDILL
jgi:hypothetical protein